MENQLIQIEPFLDVPIIRRIRRNHGLEHATIHLLSRRIPRLRVIGRSDSRGFWLLGDIPTEMIEESAEQALARMRNGEHQLAVHPNCGTNLVMIAGLGTLATLIALAGLRRERFAVLERIPMIALGIMGAVVFGQPLGMQLQQYVTTLGDPGDLQILAIERADRGAIPAHRVTTRSS